MALTAHVDLSLLVNERPYIKYLIPLKPKESTGLFSGYVATYACPPKLNIQVLPIY